MRQTIFPNNLHVKIAFTGCSNDCGKVMMDDFGFIGKWVLKDVNLNEKAEVASRVYWGGKHYDRSNNLM